MLSLYDRQTDSQTQQIVSDLKKQLKGDILNQQDNILQIFECRLNHLQRN